MTNTPCFVKDKRSGKVYKKLEEVALVLIGEGEHIIYCDIEELAKGKESGEWYLIDECGNNVWLNPEHWEVRERKK